MKKLFKISFLTSILFLGINSVSALERTCVKCGDGIEIPALLPAFVSKLILILQLAVPIILIVTGSIRYAKAVMSGDDKVIKETNASFIKSIIAAIIVFLSVAIVKFAFNILDQSDPNGKGATNSCVTCFITGDCPSSACMGRDGGRIVTPQQGCSDYDASSCPSTAPDGLKCKKTGSTCQKACNVLSMSECNKRSDCRVNGPSSCTDN